MEGLLDGLGADDFDEDDDLSEGSSQHAVPARYQPHHPPSPPNDRNIPPPPQAFSGFATASGYKLPPPSKAAMEQATKLVWEAGDEERPEAKRRRLDDTGPSTSLFQTASGGKIPPPSKTALEIAAGLFVEPAPEQPLESEPSTSLFETTSGSKVPPPAKAALQNASRVFNEPVTKPGDPGPSTSLFQTGSGARLPPPSKSALSKAAALFKEPPDTSEESSKPMRSPASSGSLFATSNGEQVPLPSEAARRTVAGLFGDDAPHDHGTPSSRPPLHSQSLFTTSSGRAMLPPSPAAQRAVVSLFTDDPPAHTSTPVKPSSGEFKPPLPRPFNAPTALDRTPLRSTLNNHAEFTPPQPSSSRFKSIDIKTPSRRLGMSTSSTPASASRKRGFVTPFKVPQARGSSIRAPPAQVQSAAPVEDHHAPVFDMTGE